VAQPNLVLPTHVEQTRLFPNDLYQAFQQIKFNFVLDLTLIDVPFPCLMVGVCLVLAPAVNLLNSCQWESLLVMSLCPLLHDLFVLQCFKVIHVILEQKCIAYSVFLFVRLSIIETVCED